MKVTATQLVRALVRLADTDEFVSKTDSVGYAAFSVLVRALYREREYMDLPDVKVEIGG